MTTPQPAHDIWGREPEPSREPGPIEKAVLKDLAMLGEPTRPGQATLVALAVKLARVLDVRGDEEAPSQTAKAIDTLRITMGKLTEVESGDADTQAKLGALLSTPAYGGSEVSATLRYPPQPGKTHPRRRGGQDRDSTG